MRSLELVCQLYESSPYAFCLRQWFSNCGTRTSSGTRRPSKWYTNRPAFCFSSQKIYSQLYLSGFVNKFLNFCVAYFPSWFLKMAIIRSHSHFLHVAFVSIMIFQAFDRMIFGILTFPGTRWYVLTVRDPQMVRNQKKFGNHWPTLYLSHNGVVSVISGSVALLYNWRQTLLKFQ